ncbi:MAG: hypothetical protein QNK23_01115 [Crocinitomicaceae bacterium]|nr:hypothetical protein [Crocinitomicaceae bacterium]
MKPTAVISFILLASLYGCNSKARNYYYNLEDFTTPKVYVFECVNDANWTQYWKMSSDVKSNYLITEAFNSSFEQIEYFKEQFNESGSELVEYTMMEGENFTLTTPIEKNVFVWSPTEEYSYSVNYSSNGDKILFRKDRSYVGLDSVEVMGQQLGAIKFKGIYHFESEKYKDVMEFWQYSYYTEEYGFVKYERHIDNDSIIILELSDILSLDAWNELK